MAGTSLSTSFGSGVPLAVVSKVLRHTQVSITADLYGHLSREIATSAADTFGAALDAAAAERTAEQAARASVAVAAQDAPTTPSHDLVNESGGPPHSENRQVRPNMCARRDSNPQPSDP